MLGAKVGRRGAALALVGICVLAVLFKDLVERQPPSPIRAIGPTAMTSLLLSSGHREQVIEPGGLARFAIRIDPSGSSPLIELGGAPTGATWEVAGGDAESLLTVRTRADTAEGTYPLLLTARLGQQRARVLLTLTVEHEGLPVLLSGPTGLVTPAPGESVALNLALTNPNGITVRISGLTIAAEASDQGCGDVPLLSATQFSGGYPLVLPGYTTLTLEQLGVPSAAWPRVMRRMSRSDRAAFLDECRGIPIQITHLAQSSPAP